MISAGLEEALVAIEAAGSLKELRRVICKIIENRGFAAVGFVDAADTMSKIPLYFGTDEAWNGEYLANNFVTVDPGLAKARRTNTPFVWADIAPGAARPGPRSLVRRLMDAAQDFGFTEGLIIPCHFRDELGRMHSISSVLYWKDHLRPFSALLGSKKAELHLLMIYFIQQHIKLRSELNGKLTPSVQLKGKAEGLTAAQRDCLSWAARGKTVGETAEILNISELTVETHIKNALRRLDVHNKTHAVAVAIMHGLIDY